MNNKYDFGTAKDFLKQGMKLAREGWNGKGMFVVFVPSKVINLNEKFKKLFGTDKVEFNQHFVIKNVDESVSTWVPSINDCLAEDWYIVD